MAALTVLALPLPARGQADLGPWDRISVIQMPFTGARNVPEISDNPSYLYRNGISDSIGAMGFSLEPSQTVSLTAADDREYGSWHRMGLANGHLADMVAENWRSGVLTVGLLGNCTSVIGVLGGLQNSGAEGGLRDVGLVFIDAHGDFNVPETTLSGMLGGMPVAVSAGMALHNLRRESGLDPGIPTEHIVMGAVRDLDPLERELVEESRIQHLSTEDLADRPELVRAQIERLARSTDVIYVHIDMDVLDPREVPGHPLTVPNGPTSLELASALTEMFRHPKVAALGIASTPANDRDPDGLSLTAAYNLVKGALSGVQQRGEPGRDGGAHSDPTSTSPRIDDSGETR
jgi:arginase